MELSKELSQGITELLEMQGDHVGMHTTKCRTYKKEHDNCRNCEFELGCTKLVKMQLSSFRLNSPDILDKILAAKSPDEVRNIRLNLEDSCL